ncbi:hypothetical protein XELAEV_18009064mg [Xenopus laevis]|uniref:Uncharacterized protein n=1 Tax=Xenopus laevis TaxID=8355 RepID=A0A974DRW9_XENLA|nr:hypothetical protein XELAEV_18009064mg [Xenopus laevis]
MCPLDSIDPYISFMPGPETTRKLKSKWPIPPDLPSSPLFKPYKDDRVPEYSSQYSLSGTMAMLSSDASLEQSEWIHKKTALSLQASSMYTVCINSTIKWNKCLHS